MNGDKISTILKEHPEMSIREIQRIPEVLEDPTLILKSKGTGKGGNNSRMVLYGSIKAQNGQPVLAVLDLRPRENGFFLNDMQKVNSAYTKDNPTGFVTGSDVLYVDKKRTIPLLRQFGLTITSRQLLRNGSVGSITYDGDHVNMSGVPFSSVVELGSGDVNTKFSLKYDRNNHPYVDIEEDILEGVPKNEWVKTVKDNLRQKFPNGITVGNNVIHINQQSRQEMTFSNYMQRLMRTNRQIFSDKLRATNNADEILKASKNWVNEALLHPRRDAIIDFARGEVLMRIGSNDYAAQVVVGNRGGGKLLLYDILYLEPTEIQEKKTGIDYITKSRNGTGDRQPTPVSKNSISKTGKDVNGKFSRSDRELLDRYIETYGEIPAGETPAREITMPRKTGSREKLSQTVRTILEAKATPEEAIPSIEKLAADGTLSYNPYSDRAAMKDAADTIRDKGWDRAQRDWFEEIKSGKVSKENTAMGWTLYNHAAHSGNTELAMDVLVNMVEHQRSAAQAVQASRILKKMSPEGQLYGVERSVNNLTRELRSKYGNKYREIKIDPELAENFLKAGTEEARNDALKEIYRNIGEQAPSTFLDKWNAWRYMSMLTNPRTHIRNVAGNAGFVPGPGRQKRDCGGDRNGSVPCRGED